MTPALQKKIMITIGLLVVSRALHFIPVPGLDYPLVNEFMDIDYMQKFTSAVGSLGIIPYVSSSTIVILFVYLRKSLRGADDRRLPIETYTLALTAVLALAQGLGQAIFYENIFVSYGGHAVANPGWAFRVPVMLQKTAAVFVFVWVAKTITQRGIGNGVCLIILTDVLIHVPDYLLGLGREVMDKGADGTPQAAAYALVAIALFFVIIWLVLTRWRVPTTADQTDSNSAGGLLLHLNSVGIAGYYLGTSLIGLVTTAAMLTETNLGQKIAQLTVFGGTGYWIILVAVTFLATYWLAALAYDPRGLKKAQENFGGTHGTAAAVDTKSYDRKLGLTTTLLTVVILAICIVLTWHAMKHELAGLAAVSLFPITAISIDTYRQFKLHLRLDADGEDKWTAAATVRTQVEAQLCRQRLPGISTEIFSNTVEPIYGTLGLFDVNPITPLLIYREIGGGRIRVLVPASDWEKARNLLDKPTEIT